MNSPLPAVPHNETFSCKSLTDGLHYRQMEKTWLLIFCAWIVAAVATLGAIFFGEVMQLPTCALCWYQRIFMFPLAIILPIGLFPFDRKVLIYALPLAVLGWLFAAFHLLLVAGLIPEDIQPCTQGVPCSETVIEWFGFVTIPLLSAVAFSVIITLLVLAFFRSPK
jgi:disulfide bond formation protein DsbB